jgi:L-ascorbate metabolism protein UlaG (beta-lactamase superfamily)
MRNKAIFFFIPLQFMIRGFCSEYPVSDHFNGKRFFNPEPNHTFNDMIRWMWNMKTVQWPKWIDDPVQPPPPDKADEGSIRITYINHATILVQIDNINILTDPMYSMRAGPFKWLGTKRIRKPGIPMDNLPRIDYILISHNHYDHLDIPTLKEIRKKYDPVVITGLGNKKLISKSGFSKVIELDWWNKYNASDNLTITFTPARHTSGRGLFDTDKTLWGGFVIQSGNKKIYFAGDTGFGQFAEQIKNRFGSVPVAILPLGNYEVRWFMQSQHINPDDAVKIHLLLNVEQSIGMHYATFAEHPEQSIHAHEQDLSKALNDHKIDPEKFRILKFGEGLNIY